MSEVKLKYAAGELRVGRGNVDDGHLGFGREVVADLVHLGADFGQRLGGVVIDLQPGGDGGQAELARGFKVVNAIGAGDHALERRGDEAAHQVGAGAHIDRGDGDRRVVAAGILPHDQGANGLDPGDQDHQVHHQRQHRPADEDVR